MQPLLQLKSNKNYIFWMCVCSLSYPACNAHAPYCHLWPVRLYKNFPHYLIKARFSKKRIEHKICVFTVSANLVWNISHSKKNWARCDQKCILVDVKHPILLSDFNENWLFSIDFRKILIYKISWKSVQWEPSCFMRTDGQTCRTTRMKRVVGFHNFANEPKNYFWIGR